MERNWIALGDDHDTHKLVVTPDETGHVSRYSVQPTGNYNWQARRIDFERCASGSVPTLEDAMREAERHLDMPIAEFNAVVARKFLERRDEADDMLKQLGLDGLDDGDRYHAGYTAGFVAGAAGNDRYHAGYTDGFEAARVAILAALDKLRAQHAAPAQSAAQVPA
jgi:hypothetical protein